MKKFLKVVFVLLMLASAFWLGMVARDKQVLSQNLIRLHVVADSDSVEDQNIKLQVRDAITERLQATLEQFPDMEAAKDYLESQLPELERIANETLKKAGSACKAVVTLTKEAFPTREYETFTLPAGVYESLRITIGSGEGKNWWCVVFPNLCVSATSDDFEDTAVSAGFSDELAGTLTGEPKYQVRFFFLDCFGWIENLIYS